MFKSKLAISVLLLFAASFAHAVPIIVEAEDDTQVSRSGSWGVFSGSVLHDGRGLEGFSSGSTLDLTFTTTGGAFSIFGGTGPNRGIFDVTISGIGTTTVDTYSSGFLFQQEYFTTSLAAGTYIVSTEVVTPYHAIDYFQYEGSAPVPAPPLLVLFGLGLMLIAYRHSTGP